MIVLLSQGPTGPVATPTSASITAVDAVHRRAADTATASVGSEYLATAQQMLSLFPRPWASDDAARSPGNLFAATSIFATMLAKLNRETAYVNQQKRIATAQADNVDAIANDFFGTGNFPRRSAINGLTVVPESDTLYAPRIAAAIIAPNNTLLAIQNAVTSYLNNGYAAQAAQSAQVLGLDTAGGLDTFGPLDGRSSTIPNIPQCTVFDIQSNPTLATSVGLVPGDFCILFTYGGFSRYGMFLDHAQLDFAYLLPDKLQVIAPLNNTLAGIVASVKAQGMRPIYADNRA